MTKKRIRITDGGIALPLGNNTFLMRGRLHSQGGIGIGNGGKNDIEVEDGEIVKFNRDNIQVLSDQPMLNGISPANALLAGGNFNKIFKVQQSINGNHHGSYGKDGLIKKLIGFFTGSDEKENNEKAEPLNIEELKLRQAYAESGFNSNAKSAKDAMGLFQIRQILLDDYNLANKTNYTLEDLKDDKLNMAVRDWKMNKNLASSWAIKNAAPDSVVYAKALGGYNMGNTDFIKGLEDAKKAGVDIYNSMDWIDTKWFPKETVDYINFILRNQNNSLSRNQLAYEASKKKNSDKVEGIRKGFKEGGEENIPTKEEYITQKLDSIRNNALERSRNKTQDETTLINELDVYGRKYLINRLQESYNIAKSFYDRMLNDKYELYKKENPIRSEVYSDINYINNDSELDYYVSSLNNAKQLLDDAKKGIYNGEALNNCIANLSEMFPHGLPYGNQTFKANPGKYGFSLIDTWDVEPGDLIQHIKFGGPYHAMIYNGTDNNGIHTFNYSDGGEPTRNGVGGYRSNKHYPDVVAEDGKHLWDVDVYRYTGTPQDSTQWSNEYDQKYGKTLKNGGQINMKLKYKNKQDITDMVMNEILPPSTGKRMKFDMGGKYLLGNIGSNILNGLAQGITGIISGSQTAKFFRNLPDIANSFIPVARQHISSDVRHILNPQLSEIKRGVSTLIDNAQKNTSSSKNYRQQATNATLKGIEESQKVYNSAAEIQTQRQIANANLQAEYDKLDTVNKINAIKEQNDYNMQRLIGEQNAKNQIAQSIGDSIGDMTKNIGNSLMDYATMKHDLLKSNQGEDYDEYFEWNNSDMIKNGTLKVPKLSITKINYKNRITKDYDKFVSIYGKDIVDGWLNQLK